MRFDYPTMLLALCLSSGMAYASTKQTSVDPANFFSIETRETAEAPRIKNMVSALEAVRTETVSPRMFDARMPWRPKTVVAKSESGDNHMKFTYLYDSNGSFYSPGQSQVRIYQRWNKEEEVWDNDSRFKLLLTSTGDIVEAYTDKGFRNQWDNQYHIIYTYDMNHNMLTCMQETWSDNEWYGTLKWENKYDKNGNMIEQQYQNRALGGGEWKNGSCLKWTYDEDNRLTEHKIMSWSDYAGKYSDYLTNEYVYDERGNLITQIQTNPSAVIKHERTYDEANNCVTFKETRFMNNSWVNFQYIEYTYDASNRQTGNMSSSWVAAGEGGDWRPNTKAEYSYEANDTTQVFYKYNVDKGEWEGLNRYVRKNDARNLPLSFTQDNWDADKKEWEPASRDTYTYDNNGNLTHMLSEAYTGVSFVATSDFEFEYDADLNGRSVKARRKQTKEWIYVPYHNMADKWGSPDLDSWIAEVTDYIDMRDYVDVESVSISESEIELETELNHKLTAVVSPANASNQEVVWRSMNPAVARVSVDGKVYGVSEGMTQVSCSTLNGYKMAWCRVFVKDGSGVSDTFANSTFAYVDGIVKIGGDVVETFVYDISGFRISGLAGAGELDTTDWQSGVYIVVVKDGNGVTHRNKITVR